MSVNANASANMSAREAAKRKLGERIANKALRISRAIQTQGPTSTQARNLASTVQVPKQELVADGSAFQRFSQFNATLRNYGLLTGKAVVPTLDFTYAKAKAATKI